MNEYWFRKRKGLFTKDLGWGWMPISIEGWIFILIFLGSIIGAAIYLEVDEKGSNGPLFLGFILFMIMIFAIVAKNRTKD